MDEGGVGREADVSGFNELDDLVFLAVVFQLHVLRVEVEGGVGIVVEAEVDLVTHLTRHVQVDLLVEVHRSGLTAAYGERRIVDVLYRGAEFQFGATLCLDSHSTGTEDLLCGTEVEVHVGKVELVLAFLLVDLVVLGAVIGISPMLLAPCHVFLGRHHDGSGHVGRADLRADDVAVDGVVVHHLVFQSLRPLQVHGVLLQVVVGDGGCPLDLPAGIQERVGNGVVIAQKWLCLGRDLRLCGVGLLGSILCGSDGRQHDSPADDGHRQQQ